MIHAEYLYLLHNLHPSSIFLSWMKKLFLLTCSTLAVCQLIRIYSVSSKKKKMNPGQGDNFFLTGCTLMKHCIPRSDATEFLI